jgi:hypothetical protein
MSRIYNDITETAWLFADIGTESDDISGLPRQA